MYISSGLVSRAPQTISVSTHLDPMAAKDPEVIDIPDEGDDAGNKVFKTMSLMIINDCKDTIHTMVTAFKKPVAKH